MGVTMKVMFTDGAENKPDALNGLPYTKEPKIGDDVEVVNDFWELQFKAKVIRVNVQTMTYDAERI
jgi:hypothetical protein